MAEQPNTAAIRAMLWNGLDVETALELCDALDAARAERDEYLAHCHKVNGRLEEWIDIAEAAEARAEAAEKNLGRWQDKAGENLIRAKVAEAERGEIKGLLDDHSRREVTRLMAYKREKARAEAAEARIANALSLVDADSPNGWGLVVRALTEGTGQ